MNRILQAHDRLREDFTGTWKTRNGIVVQVTGLTDTGQHWRGFIADGGFPLHWDRWGRESANCKDLDLMTKRRGEEDF